MTTGVTTGITTRVTPMPRPPGLLWRAFGKLRRLALMAVLLCIWQYVSLRVLDSTSRTLLPPPTLIFTAAWELISSGELLRHARDSLKREMVAFLWASISIPIGIAMGWFRIVDEQLDAIMEMLRPIPPLAWIPLSILWFGIGDEQNQFIIFLGIFFPILLNTINGVKGIEPNLIRAARCLGASEAQILWRIVVKAALPQIVTGIRIGLGVGWMALVAAELVGANSGLGFLINDARTVLRTDYIIVGMASIGVIGLLLDQLIRELGRRLLPWSRGMDR
ncbi:MAG: ABC transporter permease [Betaproteobacteria bacterium]|nr:ABC transporter permease [Betaproteobacteria bacterium]